MYESYQRLHGPERPVKNLKVEGNFQIKEEPTEYVSKSDYFYKFKTEDSAGQPFHYLVHRGGHLPHPESTKPPKMEEGIEDYLSAFPQFQ